MLNLCEKELDSFFCEHQIVDPLQVIVLINMRYISHSNKLVVVTDCNYNDSSMLVEHLADEEALVIA